MRTLIITSCTGEKKFKPSNLLEREDFLDSQVLSTRERELAKYLTPAGEMYIGMQHLRLMEGVKILRDKCGKGIVDVAIVSAGYGLIPEDKVIAPYEVTFNTMNPSEIVDWSRKLGIHNCLVNAVPQYDLVIFLLGDKYLRALELPIQTLSSQTLVFFTSPTSKKLIPQSSNQFLYEAGLEEAKAFSYGLVSLKGYLAKLMLTQLASGNPDYTLSKIKDNPEIISKMLQKYDNRKIKHNYLF